MKSADGVTSLMLKLADVPERHGAAVLLPCQQLFKNLFFGQARVGELAGRAVRCVVPSLAADGDDLPDVSPHRFDPRVDHRWLFFSLLLGLPENRRQIEYGEFVGRDDS